MFNDVATFDAAESANTQLVGLAGTLNAGKDTGAEHLAERYGFLHVSTSNILRAEAERYKLTPDRVTLTDIGINLRREYNSEAALVIMAIERWQAERDRYMGGLVVTGLRVIGEAEEVRKRNGRLLFVDAPIEVRYARMIARQRDAETTQTLEQFKERSLIEFEGVPDDRKQPNLRAIMGISRVLHNDLNDPKPFLRELDEILGLSAQI